jgi:hypothetical protein
MIASMTVAALGFRHHSGWAVMVAVSGERELLLRRRVDLCGPGVPAQLYHAARELDLAAAERLVEDGLVLARAAAGRAIADACAEVRAEVVAVGLAAKARSLPRLGSILASHPLVHAAEGELYRRAIAEAAEAAGMVVVHVAGGDADPALVAELGRGVGPPWRRDHKEAAVAALVALGGAPGTGERRL